MIRNELDPPCREFGVSCLTLAFAARLLSQGARGTSGRTRPHGGPAEGRLVGLGAGDRVGGPVTVFVDLSQQMATVYRNGVGYDPRSALIAPLKEYCARSTLCIPVPSPASTDRS